MVGGNGENQFRQYAGQNVGNLNGYNAIQNVGNQVAQNLRVQNVRNQNGLIGVPGNANLNGNGNQVAARAKGNAVGHNGNQIRCYNYRGVADLDEIEEVNANCILMANLQETSTSGTQTDKAPVYDSDGSTEVHDYENCDDNEIFNMFTQEGQYTELLKPIPEPHQVPQNDNNVISEVTSVKQNGKTVEQHPANFEETRALYDSLYQNLAIEVEKVNSVNRKLKKTNADLTTELARFKNQENNVLLEKHDPPVVHDSEETLQLAQESHEKMKELNKEIKPANYTKINHLSGVFVSQSAKSRKELYFSNDSKTANVSKSISIPNEEFLDDTTPSVARKFLNEVKSTIVTLQRVDKHRMTLETHNWSSSAHQELHKIVKDENFPLVNQVDARVQNFEIQFLKEAAKFVRDFKSLTKEADESLAKHKALELEIERLLRAVVSHDIMSVVQKTFVVDTSNLQTELERTKERFETCIIKKENEYAKLWNDLFDQKGKIVASSESESQSNCSNGDNACTSNTVEPKIKWFPNSTSLLDRVYFVEGLGHNLFSVRQFCDSDLEVAFRKNACFVRNLEGVNLLKGDRSTNLYTINLHEMASASPICLMARASSTKSWLWHQRLSHLNFDTINNLASNDLVSGLPKFKYNKEHLYPSCEQRKSKRASHPPKPVPDSRNQTLVEATRTMLIFSRAPLFLWAEAIATACFTQNRSIIYRRFNKTPYELINGRKPDISFLHVFGALCYPKNDREDIRKLGAKGDIGFFIGYSTDSRAYKIYNRMTKKIMETMNVLFDELSAMAFEQHSSKLGLQSMAYGQISSGFDLTYAPSTITTQQPTEGELDLLFEAMYDNYIGGQPSATARTVLIAPEP
nr:Gag-Pol polyprotein [Tanacetum cinerariifolium]